MAISCQVADQLKTDAEYEHHFREVFRESLRRRLRADSPVLAELSGGLDSSSIVCVADDLIKETPLDTCLDTISYYDTTELNGDDCRYFPKIEERRGRPGTHIDISSFNTSGHVFEYREFTPLPGLLSTRPRVRTERDDATLSGAYSVRLSGLGGDEFMGGIPDPTAQLGDLIVQFKIADLAKQLLAWSLVKRRPWIHLLWDALLQLTPLLPSREMREGTIRVLDRRESLQADTVF